MPHVGLAAQAIGSSLMLARLPCALHCSWEGYRPSNMYILHQRNGANRDIFGCSFPADITEGEWAVGSRAERGVSSHHGYGLIGPGLERLPAQASWSLRCMEYELTRSNQTRMRMWSGCLTHRRLRGVYFIQLPASGQRLCVHSLGSFSACVRGLCLRCERNTTFNKLPYFFIEITY